MRVLVTGGSGLIGGRLAELLAGQPGLKLASLSRSAGGPGEALMADVGDRVAVREAMAWGPDVVFHLAACARVKLPEGDPHGEALWRTNVDGTRHLLDYAPRGCRFVLASTVAVHGDLAEKGPCKEDWPCSPTSLYAASKVAAESLVQAYDSQGKVSGLILRLAANCGPAKRGLVYDLCVKASQGGPLRLIGNRPGPLKPFMHARDTAAAMAYFGFSRRRGVINVTSPDQMSVENVASLVAGLVGGGPLEWSGEAENWAGDNRVVAADVGGMLAGGFRPLYPHSEAAVVAAVKEFQVEE